MWQRWEGGELELQEGHHGVVHWHNPKPHYFCLPFQLQDQMGNAPKKPTKRPKYNSLLVHCYVNVQGRGLDGGPGPGPIKLVFAFWPYCDKAEFVTKVSK